MNRRLANDVINATPCAVGCLPKVRMYLHDVCILQKIVAHVNDRIVV